MNAALLQQIANPRKFDFPDPVERQSNALKLQGMTQSNQINAMKIQEAQDSKAQSDQEWAKVQQIFQKHSGDADAAIAEVLSTPWRDPNITKTYQGAAAARQDQATAQNAADKDRLKLLEGQQTEFGGMSLAPTPGGAQADTAVPAGRPAAPLYQAGIPGAEVAPTVLPLPSVDVRSSVPGGPTTTVQPRSLEQNTAATQAAETFKRNLALKDALIDIPPIPEIGFAGMKGVPKEAAGPLITQLGEIQKAKNAPPKNTSFEEQTYDDYLKSPEAKKFGPDRLGFDKYKQQQKLDTAAAGRAAAANVPEIGGGSKEFKIAQDLAYGKLPFTNFNQMYGRAAASSGMKTAIYEKAQELNPNFNVAQFEMGYKLASSPKVQQQLASMDNVKQAVPDLLRLSDEASRTGITALNKLIIKGGFELGSKHYANLETARTAFADELSGALGFGSATDMSKAMGLDMTRPDLSPEAFRSQIQDVVLPFIERKRDTLLKQMGVYGQPGMNPAADAAAAPAAGGSRGAMTEALIQSNMRNNTPNLTRQQAIDFLKKNGYEEPKK